MATFNQCQFIGRLGKDPELTVTSDGQPIGKFSLAVDQGKGKPTMWLNITIWDKLAETVEKYAWKGMLVFVQGKLQLHTYKDKQKVERISVEIIATIVQLLEKRKAEPGEDELPDEVLPPE
ncbi:MAG TPA: single-stranded DNA-binding protein [Ktedonobacteraceae bacterium]|nr:single-stranded DNA-binding protein [Ktedonobacteraceae bacterium]